MNENVLFDYNDVAVRVGADGLIDAKDMHRASGRDRQCLPANFLKSPQAVAITRSLRANYSPENILRSKAGRSGGTWLCRELAVAYAAYLDPDFYLFVIQVFLAVGDGRLLPSGQGGPDVIVTLDDDAVFKHGGLEFGPGTYGVEIDGKRIAFNRIAKKGEEAEPLGLEEPEAPRLDDPLGPKWIVERVRLSVELGRLRIEEARWDKYLRAIRVPAAREWKSNEMVAWRVDDPNPKRRCFAIPSRYGLLALELENISKQMFVAKLRRHGLLLDCEVGLPSRRGLFEVLRVEPKAKYQLKRGLWLIRNDRGQFDEMEEGSLDQD